MLRKTKTLLAFSLVWASLAVTPAFAASNLLTNGGFESYTSGQTANDWNVTVEQSPQSAYVEISSTEVASGTYSQRISQDGSTFEGDELGIESDTSHTAVPGKSLELTFKANVVSMAGAELIPSVKFWDVNGDYIGKIKTTITSPTGGWKDFTHVVVTPANATEYAVGFEVPITQDGGYYNLYIDDVGLQEIAGSGDTTEVGVVGGDLTFSTVPGVFNQLKINNDWSVLDTTMMAYANIIDSRASGEGWSFKIAATDFRSEPLSDPSSNGGTFVLKIPANTLKLETTSLTTVSGQAIDPINGPLANNFTLSNSSQTLIKAEPGFGMGAYQVSMKYTLLLPKTLEIISQTGTGSKFEVGDFVGAREGKYTATLNFTAGTGL